MLDRFLASWRRNGGAAFDAGIAADTINVARRRIATVIGAVLLGLTALLLAFLGDWAQRVFHALLERWPYAPLALTPAVFAGVVYVTRRWLPETAGSGIPQVIAATRALETAASGKLISLRTAAGKLVATIAMLFAGASVGREGPTVQVSAAIMVTMHRLLQVPISAGVVIAGGAAGVAAAFNTPLAGVAFAIEELAAAYEQRVAVLVMGAVMIAGLVSLGIAGDYVYFGAMRQTLSLREVFAIAPFAGVIGGLAGGAFTRMVLSFSRGKRRLPSALRSRPVLFAAACGLATAIIGLACPADVWGTGYETTRAMVESHPQSLWFGPAKFATTLAATLSGAPGGVFAPSLAVGAGIGELLTPFYPDSAAGPIVVLGMVAYFVGVVRAPFTAIIIISEATAGRGMILPLFATALIAEGASALVCRERLYHGLAQRYLPKPASDDVAPAQRG